MKKIKEKKKLEKVRLGKNILKVLNFVYENPIILYANQKDSIFSQKSILQKIGVGDITPQKKNSYNKVFDSLIQKGYLQKINSGEKIKVIITKSGKERLGIFPNKNTSKKWDKKWRLVSFDVYENNRSKRDLFRTNLKKFGFQKFQNSIWIYPYDAEEFISLSKNSEIKIIIMAD